VISPVELVQSVASPRLNCDWTDQLACNIQKQLQIALISPRPTSPRLRRSFVDFGEELRNVARKVLSFAYSGDRDLSTKPI
jgi:hypothetical protein